MKEIYWESASTFVERQTQQIKEDFKTSRPKPRDRNMGFKGEPRKRRKYRGSFGDGWQFVKTE